MDRFEDPRHIKWAKLVKQRDNYTCQVCGATNTYLNSHHKNSYDYFELQRFDLNNGVCLCQQCHNRFHEIYGSGKNTICQFEEYSRIMNLIHNLFNKINA